MNIYNVCGISVSSPSLPPQFEPFLSGKGENGQADLRVEFTDKPFSHGEAGAYHPDFAVFRVENGWIYESADKKISAFANDNYTSVIISSGENPTKENTELILRLIVECRLIISGGFSLHSSSVTKNGLTFCLTGRSGVGKSTRAEILVNDLGFELISGDRPAILSDRKTVSGVPWDGKEKVYKNIKKPLDAVLEVRRSEVTKIEKADENFAFSFLANQIFIPMWDSSLSAKAILNLKRFTASVPFFTVYSDITADSQKQVIETLRSLL